ncbi:MAG: hypothetical protein ACI35O_16950 [Bacillaceae bacterium]
MPTFRSIKEMEQYVNKQTQDALYNRRKTFENIGSNHVEKDVYKAYTPNPVTEKTYQRTGKLKESFVTTPIDNGISIDNTRSEGGRDIARIIEKGHYDSEGYEHVKPGAPYLLPRPFMKETKQEIKDMKLHVTELQKGLKQKGIKTIR